jgi:hypothetical protein
MVCVRDAVLDLFRSHELTSWFGTPLLITAGNQRRATPP